MYTLGRASERAHAQGPTPSFNNFACVVATFVLSVVPHKFLSLLVVICILKINQISAGARESVYHNSPRGGARRRQRQPLLSDGHRLRALGRRRGRRHFFDRRGRLRQFFGRARIAQRVASAHARGRVQISVGAARQSAHPLRSAGGESGPTHVTLALRHRAHPSESRSSEIVPQMAHSHFIVFLRLQPFKETKV
jgi:hypothetical protein